MLILAFSSAITAQVKTKKVAILETVDKENKVEYGVELQLRGYLTDAINRTPGYEGYDRVDMASILGEHNFQRTGLVSDAQIKKLGEMTGASSIIVAEAAMYGSDRIIIIAKIIDVETARIENTARPKVASTSDDGMAKACAELAIELLGITSDTRSGNGSRSEGKAYSGSQGAATFNKTDAPLTKAELKNAGFKFLAQNKSVEIIMSNQQKKYIYKVPPSQHDPNFSSKMICYGGKLSMNGNVNGVVILRPSGEQTSYLGYICDGKLTMPIIEVGFYDEGLFASLEEGIISYGCIFPSWREYSCFGLCESIRELYGIDFSDPGILNSIYNRTINLDELERAFIQFVRSGKYLSNWVVDDDDNKEYWEFYE